MVLGQFEVNFVKNRCKGCSLCVEFCPMKIVYIDETVINEKGYNVATIKDRKKCVGCSNCAVMCPDSVITISKI